MKSNLITKSLAAIFLCVALVGCAGNAYFKPLSTSQAVAMVLQDAPAIIKASKGDYLSAVATGLYSIAGQLQNKSAADTATLVAKTVNDFSGGKPDFVNLALDLASTIGGSKQPDADALNAASAINAAVGK